MKIAIHHDVRPSNFSGHWIRYCKKNGVAYKAVDCFSTDIIADLRDCDALMWHHNNDVFEDTLVAKNVLFAVEQSGKKTFPDFNTCWHFDDKVAQKYLLEAVGAPLVPSFVFYGKKEALGWIDTTTFPKVFKLKGGDGSKNVQLVRSRRDAKKLVRKAFGKGFSQFNRKNHVHHYLLQFKKTRRLRSIVKAMGGLVLKSRYGKMQHNERGYAYFQDFIENEGFDLRVIIIRGRAFGMKRLVRENDFRASGSGNLVHDAEQMDAKSIEIAYEVNKSIKSQSIAFDFVTDRISGNRYIVEISYGYFIDAYIKCEGYWTDDLVFHPGSFNPQEWMIEGVIERLQSGDSGEMVPV